MCVSIAGDMVGITNRDGRTATGETLGVEWIRTESCCDARRFGNEPSDIETQTKTEKNGDEIEVSICEPPHAAEFEKLLRYHLTVWKCVSDDEKYEAENGERRETTKSWDDGTDVVGVGSVDHVAIQFQLEEWSGKEADEAVGVAIVFGEGNSECCWVVEWMIGTERTVCPVGVFFV